MADKEAIQNEKYWRGKIADEIEQYADGTHPAHDRLTTCLRCDITAVLRNVAREVRAG